MTANPGGKESFILSAFLVLREHYECWFLADRPHLAGEDRITELGGRIAHVRPRSRSPLGYLADLRALYQEVTFSVVWSNQTVLNTIAPLGFAKRAGVPVRISHSHSTQNMGTWVAGALHPVNKRLLPLVANRRFACSLDAAAWFYGDASAEVIPNMFDVEGLTFDTTKRAAARARLGIGGGAIVLIHVARFGVEKNHELDLGVVRELVSRGRDVVLLLVGDGERRGPLEDLVRRDPHLVPRVRFLGIRDDVPELLMAADLMLLPSRFEGKPYSVLEAQAAGLPCLVSDRVSSECRAGGRVEAVGLDAPPSVWANAVEEVLGSGRRVPGENPLRGSAYDLATSSGHLRAAIRDPQWTR